MDHEQEEVLSRLIEEGKNMHQKLNANTAAFLDHIYTLKGLLQEVAEKSVMSGVKFLTNILTKSALLSCESLRPHN